MFAADGLEHALRCGVRLSIATALLALSSGCADDRPDLILISLDSVRADALTFRDPRVAPQLTELARRGTVFTQATSGSSWTLPAHVQLFTGTPPPLHGVQADDLRIDPRMPMLAEQLRASGYQTAGIFTTGYLWGDYGFDRGFDSWQSAIHPEDLALEDASRLPRGLDQNLRRAEMSIASLVSSPSVVERVRRVLDGTQSDEPLFLFLHFFDPHYDYVPRAPWDKRFDPSYRGSMTGKGFYDNPLIWDEDADPKRRIGTRDLEHIRALYRGEVGWTDQNLGEIFSLLEAHGRLRNAAIIVTSDHGEEFFEHGERGHRHTLYDELLRVPLLVVPPPGANTTIESESEVEASLSDLAPTLLDYAGVEVPASMYGRSLRPSVEGQAMAERPVIASLYASKLSRKGKERHRFVHSIRTRSHKLVRVAKTRPNGTLFVPEIGYFDLESDPSEQWPVTDVNDPRLRAQWQVLEDELARLRAHWARLQHTPDVDRTTDMRDLIHDRLAALGYVEGPAVGTHPSLEIPWGLAPFPALDFDVGRANRAILGEPEVDGRPPADTNRPREESPGSKGQGDR